MVSGVDIMIQRPKIETKVFINYKNKAMPYQGSQGIIRLVGRGIVNCLVEIDGKRVVIPHGNLNFTEPKVDKQRGLF